MLTELQAGLGILFTALGFRGMSTWTQTNRPLIFWRLGQAGYWALQVLQAIILLGGLSLIVWGLIFAAWWSTPIALALAVGIIILSRMSIYLDACICSVFGPVLCSIGIVSLHFCTWLRMAIP